jgi:hypothetical protein
MPRVSHDAAERATLMQKLLAKFRQDETAANALRLLAYLDKHPFAELIAAGTSHAVMIDALRTKRARAIYAVHCARAA